MRCIVSGGRGFIGRRIVQSLLHNGHEAAVWSRTPARETRSAVAAFYWDPLGPEPSEDSFKGVDAVVHLAGEPVSQRWTPEAKRRIRESRVQGAERLVHAISRLSRRPAALICASAVGYYGSRGDEELTESSPAGKGFLADVCRDWERTAETASALGLRVAKIRIGLVLGPDGGALAAMKPAFQAFAGGTFGSGRQWMPWIHVDDLVKMFVTLVENPVHETWNGSAPNPVSNGEFTRALGKALHRPALLRVPAFALRTLLGEMSDVVLNSQRALPAAAAAAGFVWRHTALEEALGDLVNS